MDLFTDVLIESYKITEALSSLEQRAKDANPYDSATEDFFGYILTDGTIVNLEQYACHEEFTKELGVAPAKVTGEGAIRVGHYYTGVVDTDNGSISIQMIPSSELPTVEQQITIRELLSNFHREENYIHLDVTDFVTGKTSGKTLEFSPGDERAAVQTIKNFVRSKAN